MLTSPPTIHRVLVSLATLAAAVLVAISFPTAASADDPSYNGGGSYSNGETQPPSQGTANPAAPIDGGTPGPECELSSNGEAQSAGAPPYCTNFNYCFDAAPGRMPRIPEGPKPSEDSELTGRWCHNNGTLTLQDVFWSEDAEPDEPSELEQALEAIGQIDLTTATLQTSPDGRTLVNLDTWYWLDGAQEEATGSSALGLVAIATFRTMSVDPGDGTGTFTCDDLVTSAEAAEDSCTHTYRGSSRGGSTSLDGRPAFGASVTAVYDLSFEIDGVPVARIDGAPETLDSPPTETAVRVDEIQSTVTGLR